MMFCIFVLMLVRCGFELTVLFERFVADYVDVLDPDYFAGVVAVQATCTSEGMLLLLCLRCGDNHFESIPVLEYEWDDGVVTVEPTKTFADELTFT